MKKNIVSFTNKADKIKVYSLFSIGKERFITFDNSKSSERQRDKATIELLRKLREELLSDDISTARLAALNLSWKQENGLAILTEALFGNYPRTAKKAAAYGLRSMNGRMRKMASEVLEQGLKHYDRTTKAACIKSISLMKSGLSEKAASHNGPASGKQKIREITKKIENNRGRLPV